MAKPLMNRIRVVPMELDKVSKGGIILTSKTRSLVEVQCNVGTITEIGPLAFKGTAENIEDSPQYKVGDVVYFTRYGGAEIPQKGGGVHRILRWDDVIAAVEDTDDIMGF